MKSKTKADSRRSCKGSINQVFGTNFQNGILGGDYVGVNCADKRFGFLPRSELFILPLVFLITSAKVIEKMRRILFEMRTPLKICYWF